MSAANEETQKQPIAITKMHVVSQTHWDREWYEDFQGFRTRLVYMIDELLDHMEQDPEYKYFMMDGQTIVLEDYLEIRPENRGRLAKLIQAGRISIGPWYVMPDEYLVSGEALIRNLEKGMKLSRTWGVEPMMSGFVTDIFGHNSQLPQILRQFGIDNAVLFRGFRGDGDPAEIWWEGADGSRVLGLKLDEDRSYSDFYFAIRWPFFERDDAYEAHREEVIQRAAQLMAYKNERATTSLGIGMDGVDHIEIEPQMGTLLRMLNNADELKVEFVHSTLEAYLAELRTKIGELRVYKGELREQAFDGVNNWVPENTLSSRVHLKQHNDRCETLLEKWTEPLAVITALEGRAYPAAFIDKAWEFVLQNHPHDSICGCSIDQVHRDMMYRFDQSRLISEQMIKEQMHFIADHLDEEALGGRPAFTVFNPSQTAIDGVIEVELSLPAGTDASVTWPFLGGTSFRLYDSEQREVAYQLIEVKRNRMRRYRPYRELPRGETVDRLRIAFPAQVPAMGYATYLLEKYTIEPNAPLAYSAPKMVAPVRHPGSMQTGENSWDNGRITVSVDSNGTINVADKASGHQYSGLLLFEDEGDIGDGWSHIPPVANTRIRSTGARAVVTSISDGPYQATIGIELQLSLPCSAAQDDTGRSSELADVPVSIVIDLKRNDPLLYIRTAITNTVRDHRLLLLFPTGLAAEHYYTSTPFDFVRRDITQPDRSDYLRKPFETVPHNGIIMTADDKQGMAIYSKGLYEAFVRDHEQRTIALTLYRSTGKEVLCDGSDGGQLLGKLEFEYAIRLFAPNEMTHADLWKEYQRYAAGVRTADRREGKLFKETLQGRTADLPLTGGYLSLDSSGLILSSYRQSPEGGSYLVRMFNIEDSNVQGRLTFRQQLASAELVDLDGRPLEGGVTLRDKHTLELTAKAKQIVTIRVKFAV
ncbi:alpha-mannosidase [Paenibacillus sp. GCM10027626]|uniref:alpha-mannosidase n=1 Tax=Paenibacillus sp. GCM10027626 TaxID=3273411 RepID=UPI0036451809